MTREHLRRLLLAAVVAFFTAWGAVGCLLSAFDLTLQKPGAAILACGCCAAGTALLLSYRHGGRVLLCLLALGAGYVHQDGTALKQLQFLITHLSTIYDRAYGWGTVSFSASADPAGFVDWPLYIWGILIILAVCRNVCRQKSLWLPVLLTVLPLCSCIVVTDTVPEESFLLMVMAGLILLVLSSSVRREDAAQGDRLMAAAVLPVLLALGGLFLAIPHESYVNQSGVLRENILTAFHHLPQLMETGMGELASGLKSQPPQQVDLASLGDWIPFTYPVMEVTTEDSGTLYLRGQDYDVYDGLRWMATEERSEAFSGTAGPQETVRIRTQNRKTIQYLPYHPGTPAALTGGCAENPEGAQDYQILRSRLPEDWRQTAYGADPSGPEEWQPFLSLPETTRQGAEEYLAGFFPETASNTEKADIIAALVIDSARYDTRSGKMPEGKTDFALWFLRDAKAGYCVHFATAAAVLLRAAGVPARYVTGYMLEAQAGQAVSVTEENAHAWAEYFEPSLNVWLPLEVTPASEEPAYSRPRPAVTEPESVTETTESAQTLPEETQKETEATLPAESIPAESMPAETVPMAEMPSESDEPAVWMLLFLPVLALLLTVQRSLRLSIRRRVQRTGSTGQQALRRWQEAVRLARLLKESPTEELIVLAQKAKFSQHELSQEELSQFDSFHRSCLRRLRQKNWYMQLIYKYIYAAY